MALARLRLGTRASPLARAQAGLVQEQLAAAAPGTALEPVLIRTTGDRVTGSLAAAGGKGLFVKEIEAAILAGRVELGVHSMKDLPGRLADGLVVAAVPCRADPRDVLVARGGGTLAELPRGARVGTASPRRRALLLARRPDVEVVLLRGNVETRLRRWREGDLDAIVLAAAGLARLGVTPPEARPLPVDEFLPAVGQGAIALECRADDAETCAIAGLIHDPAAGTATTAERAFLAAVGGDCGTALAAHATVGGGRVELRVLVADPDGRRTVAEHGTAPVEESAALGRTLAARVLAAGGAEILRR